MGVLRTVLRTDAPLAVIFVRLTVGAVFFFGGVQKFLFPDALGAGRFAKIGIPWPGFTGPFVGTVEIVCGALILLGLATRLAAAPLVINMLVAILSTKIPILLGRDLWGFHVAKLPHYGFWSMVHEARVDWAMLLGSTFLLIVGAGRWSLDAVLAGRRRGEL